MRGAEGFSPPSEKIQVQSHNALIDSITKRSNTMNATKLIVAAGFALATTGVFAETGVGTVQIENVANVYGRAGVANVKVYGTVAAQPASVDDAGRNAAKGDNKTAVTSGKDVIEFGRS
jgi:hypothetical protein